MSNLAHDEWKRLSTEMTVKVISSDLAELYRFNSNEEREMHARRILNVSQDAMNVQYRMGQALIVLQQLGYEVKRAST